MSFKDNFLATPQGPAREKLIIDELIKRGPPKELVPVTVNGPNGTKITYKVMPDVITIDGLRVPMTASTAQFLANHFGMSLPSDKMSKQIYQAADTKIRAIPLSSSGFSHGGKHYSGQDVVDNKIGDSDAAVAYSQKTDEELKKHQETTGKTPTLIAGHGKDIIQPLSTGDRMSIGGWHGEDGKPLQPYSSPHDAKTQVEYGTWTRLVSDDVTITTPSGEKISTTMDKVLSNPEYYSSLSTIKGEKKYNTGHVETTPESHPEIKTPQPPKPILPSEPVRVSARMRLLQRIQEFLDKFK